MVDAAAQRTARGSGASEPVLRLDGVTSRFGGLVALSDISIDVPAGSRYGIIGPNGAGKTTLFNVVSGELKPSVGSIRLFGVDATHMSARKRVGLGLGRTYQITRTFNTLSVRENLALSLFGLCRSKFDVVRSWRTYRDVGRCVDEMAERFDLRDRLDVSAGELSHGEIRELEVALAISLEPRLLLLDEPGAGLSPGERIGMQRILGELTEALTLVMIEHDMDLVRAVVDTISVLHYGELIAHGPVADIQRDERVREIYLGATGSANGARE